MTEPTTTSEIRYVSIDAKYAAALVQLERVCFPNTDPDHLLSLEGARIQAETFPAGGFVALDDDTVAGYGMGIFVDFDISEPQHEMDAVLGPHGAENHTPLGRWYYGSGIAVLPEYRGHGIGRHLYSLRKQVVESHNRAGIIAGAEIPGYADVKDSVTAEEYVSDVVAGRRNDPTLSFQLANGFKAIGVVADFMPNPKVDNWASFIVWHNPTFDEAKFESQRAVA